MPRALVRNPLVTAAKPGSTADVSVWRDHARIFVPVGLG